MANISISISIFIIIIILIISSRFIQTKSQLFSKKLSSKEIGLKNKKLSHLHFNFHACIAHHGLYSTTTVRIAESRTTNTTTSLFGYKGIVIDDPLTLREKVISKIVTSAQGLPRDSDKVSLLKIVFTDGKFNGSTLSIARGRNSVLMLVIGGSGVFQSAIGYAQAKKSHTDDDVMISHNVDMMTKESVVEYNVYVFHD